MSTLARIIAGSIISLFVTSCNFDINFGPGISGDGNVVKEKRKIENEFNGIKVSRGIEVILYQGRSVSLEVEADENLQDVITTEFDDDNNLLRITSNENIKSAASKKVHLSVTDLSRIITTSGSYVYSETSFDLDKLHIESTSGSRVNLDLDTEVLKVSSTSGAGIKLEGSTNELTVSSTSGSYVSANNLRALTTNVSASSGANITVNTQKALTASASSGGNITYSGNPKEVEKNNAVSGRISAQ